MNYDFLNLSDQFKKDFQKLASEICILNVQNSKRGPSYDINTSHIHIEKFVTNLNHLYNEIGLGYKSICKIISFDKFQISYVTMRKIFKVLGIETRKGMNCITDSLKKMRSENARKNNPWCKWVEKNPTKDEHHIHHLCGFYYNNSKNKWVYLRSSWEFAYARWLDERNVKWDVEVETYMLSDGRSYRPDFFIYCNNVLDHIVEIKSTYTNGALNRVDKFHLFCKEYSELKSMLITEELFSIVGKTPHSVLNDWKNIRKFEKDVKNV